MASSEGARLGGDAARRLARTGQYEIGPGLTDAEFARIEGDYGFEFADDHRAFLAAGLPLNRPPEEGQTWLSLWPDWRDGDADGLLEQLCWPVDGALFDVERNALWHPSWGPRPAGTSQALDTARQHLARAPKMIPVYAHRYLPAGRGTCGHPVLSIVQTDIIVYGTDLAEYISHEFTDPGRCISPDWVPPPMVPFSESPAHAVQGGPSRACRGDLGRRRQAGHLHRPVGAGAGGSPRRRRPWPGPRRAQHRLR